ncbi:hypothetical protein ACQQ2N_09960 [Dokdonella sp. MW10]|uniref:hypothetical protein n=1 Tax=Dokdonella sp. MW10 TaxID=2992926 RepID=UPI003F7EB786
MSLPSRVFQHAARAALIVFALAFAPQVAAVDDPVSGARLVLTPDPPPADQAFDAILYRLGNSASLGFYSPTPGAPSMHHVTTDGIDVLYDLGCGFLCPPGPDVVYASPLVLPALSAGPHRVRIVTTLDANPTVLAEFPIVVGGGAPTVATLPVGGGVAGALLAALVAMAAALRLRRREHA